MFTGFIAGLIVGSILGGMLVFVLHLTPDGLEESTVRIFEELEGDFHDY